MFLIIIIIIIIISSQLRFFFLVIICTTTRCAPLLMLQVSECSTFFLITRAFVFIIIIIYHRAEYLEVHTWNNHTFNVYNIAGILWLLFLLHVMLFPMINVSFSYIIIIIIITITIYARCPRRSVTPKHNAQADSNIVNTWKKSRLWWFVVWRCEKVFRAGTSNVRITGEWRRGEVSEGSWCHVRF